MSGVDSKSPSVGILASNPIGDDPRVRRQIVAFSRASWSVHAVVPRGETPLHIEGCDVVSVGEETRGTRRTAVVEARLIRSARRLVYRGIVVARPSSAVRFYWASDVL